MWCSAIARARALAGESPFRVESAKEVANTLCERVDSFTAVELRFGDDRGIRNCQVILAVAEVDVESAERRSVERHVIETAVCSDFCVAIDGRAGHGKDISVPARFDYQVVMDRDGIYDDAVDPGAGVDLRLSVDRDVVNI